MEEAGIYGWLLEAGIYGWLLEAGSAGDFEKASNAFKSAAAIADRLANI
jgi:hypothetical protein